MMVSAHVPDVASNKQNAIVIRLGMERDMVLFNRCGKAMSLVIPDEFSRASEEG